MKNVIKTECSSCNGTGLYRGFAEPPGVAVICLHCDGEGCKEINYTPFSGRKSRNDVKTVQRSSGSFIGTGVGPSGKSISYQEFLQGKRP